MIGECVRDLMPHDLGDFVVGGLHLLDEMKAADEINREQWGGLITPLQFAEFVTRNAAKAAGIESLTKVHTLRHTFASHLVMKGVDLPTVKKLMGHSDIQTTMVYAHLAPDHLAEAVDRLEFS